MNKRIQELACIRSLTDQCAALIQKCDELQKQVWRYERHGVTCQTYRHKVESTCSECNVQEQLPAAQRQWVGLTDEEVMNCYMFWVVDLQDIIGFYKGIETKLKEKNT